MGRTVTPLSYDFAGSNPALPTNESSFVNSVYCRRSSGVERFLGKEEVVGSNPIVGSSCI